MLEHTAALKPIQVTFSFCRNQCSCVRSQIARSGDSTQLKFSTFRCLPYFSELLSTGTEFKFSTT